MSTAARSIDLIVIHCSASPNGRAVSVGTINDWHRARGFVRKPEWLAKQQAWLKNIGYHFVITLDGVVVNGRHVDEIGAHVAGFNAHSLGICMVGTDAFTTRQWDALKRLVSDLRLKYSGARICGHRDLSPDQNKNGVVEPFEWLKTCPGFDVATWLDKGPAPKNILTAGARR